jgi:hypothetical protein
MQSVRLYGKEAQHRQNHFFRRSIYLDMPGHIEANLIGLRFNASGE